MDLQYSTPLPPGTVCCILCHATVIFKRGDATFFNYHMKNQHSAFYSHDYMLASCLQPDEEVNRVIEVLKYHLEMENDDIEVEEACVKEQASTQSGNNLLYNSTMPQIKREMIDPTDNWPKRRKGGEFKCPMCDKDYAYKQNLANHMSRAHGVKQEIMPEDNGISDSFNISGQYEPSYIGNYTDEINFGESSINEVEGSSFIDGLDDVVANLVGKNTCEDLDTVMAGLEETEKDNMDDMDTVMADLDEVIVRNKNILENTEQAIDDVNKFYSCDFCLKNFPNLTSLVTHKKAKHKEFEPTTEEEKRHIPCHSCNKRYSSMPGLKLHIKTKHNNYSLPLFEDNMSLQSSYPDNTFVPEEVSDPIYPYEFNMKQDKPYVCTFGCGKSYTTQNNLSTHEIKEHNRPLKNGRKRRPTEGSLGWNPYNEDEITERNESREDLIMNDLVQEDALLTGDQQFNDIGNQKFSEASDRLGQDDMFNGSFNNEAFVEKNISEENVFGNVEKREENFLDQVRNLDYLAHIEVKYVDNNEGENKDEDIKADNDMQSQISIASLQNGDVEKESQSNCNENKSINNVSDNLENTENFWDENGSEPINEEDEQKPVLNHLDDSSDSFTKDNHSGETLEEQAQKTEELGDDLNSDNFMDVEFDMTEEEEAKFAAMLQETKDKAMEDEQFSPHPLGLAEGKSTMHSSDLANEQSSASPSDIVNEKSSLLLSNLAEEKSSLPASSDFVDEQSFLPPSDLAGDQSSLLPSSTDLVDNQSSLPPQDFEKPESLMQSHKESDQETTQKPREIPNLSVSDYFLKNPKAIASPQGRSVKLFQDVAEGLPQGWKVRTLADPRDEKKTLKHYLSPDIKVLKTGQGVLEYLRLEGVLEMEEMLDIAKNVLNLSDKKIQALFSNSI